MTVSAWLLWVVGLFALVGFVLLQALVPGKGRSLNRLAGLRQGLLAGCRAHGRTAIWAFMGLVALNTYMALFPMPPLGDASSVSEAEKWRVTVAVALYVVCLLGWYRALWGAAMVMTAQARN